MRLAAVLICLAAPAAAQDTFALPQGCDAFVTVQGASCQVDHHFVCDGDPDGIQRRISLDERGVVYAGQIDAEAQWIESFHPLSAHTERLQSNPDEPASLSELIAKGVDDYDFVTVSPEFGETRYVGQDTLTGRQIVIDGVTLDETTYDVTAMSPDGTVVWQSKGREFIHRDWRMFLSGTGVTEANGETFDKNNAPVEFMFPGQSGFLSSNPKHGCGLAIS